MKLICDLIFKQQIIEKLNLLVAKQQTVNLSGYQAVHCSNHIFYLEKASLDTLREFLVLDIDEATVWELDKVQSPISLAKQFVQIQGDTLQPDFDGKRDCYIYTRRQDDSLLEHLVLPNQKLSFQLNTCDLYLMIPGKLSKNANTWNLLPCIHSQVFTIFKNNIDSVVTGEYNTTFAKSLERKCIAQVVLEVEDLVNQKIYHQNALVGIVKHETGFCILEIIIQNCAIGGTKILNYYCGDQIRILFHDIWYSIDDFCKMLQIRRFGRKRSMVFAYSDVSTEEIVNALANEEYPMGTISGDFLQKVKSDNIAQYDTADVYVSHETMFEKCHTMDIDSDRRLSYHSIEIFFVELILLQDASVDKIYIDLQKEEELQRNFNDPTAATERYEQISFDMERALRFSDYDQFKFPSVRKSAMKVSERFGVRYIYEKYETNKELLASMIATNKRRIQDKQDRIKNQFLLLLSALASVGTLGDILYAIHEDTFYGLLSYVIALVIIVGMFILYKLVSLIAKWIYPRIIQGKSKKGH